MRFQIASSLAILASVTAAAAVDTVDIYLPPDADLANLAGKVVGTTGGSLTTLILGCASTTSSVSSATATSSDAASADDDETCNLQDDTYTLTVGSSTYGLGLSYRGTTFSEGCTRTGTTYLSCTTSASDSDGPSTSSDVYTTPLTAVPVTITGYASASATGSASASGTGSASSKSTDSSSAKSTSGSSASGSGSSTAAASASSTDNGALPLATGSWVAGGAAMMLALAMA
ncbi:putative GPI anchored glycoprotein [Aspergillus saccharolyticus JOP 1030-1]|uniref:GPI anchored protein n=1 Tax=Aspergillus saccharolyticus JOP 1030-1 TaxID=1450539 RepID=A0A318ZMG7_9EURO|nr:hypothetical protein BP01DRAFT_194326 [Aspergillus saccharolyticus JOP 1030-1]PYH47674.1 hypothetical protein BP01DRAFT_194326 [Aspergillus saccharolyticus JOP 1030-1]